MVHVHGRRRVGATMPPEGKDNLKGQTRLGCKRNSVLPLTHLFLAGVKENCRVACRGVSPLYPDWGILGKSPKLLPCQHGTVCRKSV